MIDLEKTRAGQWQQRRMAAGCHPNSEPTFNAGFTSGVAAIVVQLKADLNKARQAETIARQHAAECNYPADAISYMRGACEARAKVEYLGSLLFDITGEEY